MTTNQELANVVRLLKARLVTNVWPMLGALTSVLDAECATAPQLLQTVNVMLRLVNAHVCPERLETM